MRYKLELIHVRRQRQLKYLYKLNQIARHIPININGQWFYVWVDSGVDNDVKFITLMLDPSEGRTCSSRRQCDADGVEAASQGWWKRAPATERIRLIN